MSWMLSVYSACMVAHGFADQSAAHASVVAPAVQTHTASHVSGSRTSRHDHDVAALQHDVLFEMLASADLIIFELRRLLLLALTAKDGDAVEVGEWRRAARHAERLHHVHVAIDDELARLIDLAEHVYLVARGLADRHRDHRVGDVHRKALGYLLTQGLRCLALCLHFTDQRHRETAVRPHQQLQLQILLLPYGDLQYVAWMHGVRREFFRRNTKRYAPERQNDCNHAGHGVDPFLWKVEMSSGDCSMTLAYHTEGI